MLSLKNITKDYVTGDSVVHALRGVSLDFRRSEFVSILGASGCGKTTLLNIVGGLDRYTSGDLVINGVSTKEYTDGDWDAYRNHTIGFVFQTYNLIGHQTVLGNVELALTLSGASKEVRREKAAAALEKVGLKEYLNKKPNQLSGGQMQRVAIARAIVNDPDIILADEPTGALDTATSVQIMDILKEIAADRLVIMVTHNPDLAARYSTRIVHLSDGLVIADTDPVTVSEVDQLQKEEAAKAENAEIHAGDGKAKSADNARKRGVNKKKRPSMSFITALSLSLRNLLTKKARTILVSFAGSIGIIGIALILSMSDGFQVYINKVQEDTLSSYPLIIQSQTVDMSSMVSAMMGIVTEEGGEKEPDTVYSRGIMADIIKTLSQSVHINDLKKFNEKLLAEEDLRKHITAIRYTYDLDLQIYFDKDQPLNKNKETFLVNPSTLLKSVFGSYSSSALSAMGGGVNNWTEMLDNPELLSSQYDLVGDSRWPQNYDEVVIAIDTNNEINDFMLYSLGLLPQSDIIDLLGGKEIENDAKFTYDQLLGLRYKLLVNTEKYDFDNLGYHGEKEKEDIIRQVEEGGDGVIEIKVVGIVKPKKSAAATSINGTIGYTSALTKEVIRRIAASDIVKAQLMREDVNVLTGEEFNVAEGESLESNLRKFGYAEEDSPITVRLYAADFASKDKILNWIENYNAAARDEGRDEDIITYTDYVGIMMSSVSTIISAISYVLIGFVAISLVVSSIMIGVITYISVLERTKEIGILRSIGASKKDISRVFNAETFIVGAIAGALGVLIAMLIDIPINIILAVLANLPSIAMVPWWGAIGLVAISIGLTLVAGIIPAGIAAKRDPVVALRTE